MKFRKLRNLEVYSIGLGCMGFSQSYPKSSRFDKTYRKQIQRISRKID